MIAASLFPKLTAQNHTITSPPTTKYNCIAWAAGDTTNWWQPGIYWPVAADPLDESVAVLVTMFQFLGFEVCTGQDLEADYDKVVLYAIGECYSHAARQLASGRWTSKLGNEDDIEHDNPDDVAGGVYGNVAVVMRRKTNGG
jgi:hypothetical protein